MKDKKEILKIILVLIIILGVVIFSIIYYKQETEAFVYENILKEESLQESSNIIVNEDEISELNIIKVYVTGEVNVSGVKELQEGARIEDAIIAAGGLTTMADITKVNLAYCLEDGQKLYIPCINDQNKEYIASENGSGVIENAEEGSENIVNINKASLTELTKLPGVGESLAQRIVNYREENGKFKSIEDLKNVSGIGDKKFESLKEYIKVK